jgi:hypothetical protein
VNAPFVASASARARPVFLAVVCGLFGVNLPSQAFPVVDADPEGVVLDDQLRPVADATVTLVWEHHDRVPFGRSIAARLAKSPLPICGRRRR